MGTQLLSSPPEDYIEWLKAVKERIRSAQQKAVLTANREMIVLYCAFRSHSDGNLFFAAGTKPLILGPGALETAHTPDEQVVFAEVAAAARIYAALCIGVCRT